MSRWKPLDMMSTWGHPAPGDLTALRMVPRNAGATFYNGDRWDIGTFAKDTQTGRKLWWHGTRGCQDPVRMKKHYDIFWCPVHEFDCQIP